MGKINFGLILRIVELVLLIFSLTLFFTPSSILTGAEESLPWDWVEEILAEVHRGMKAIDAMNSSTSAFLILLVVILSLKIIKDEDQDQNFMGVLGVIGAILLIATGISVCIISDSGLNALISGVMAIVAGAAFIVEALKDFGVF